MSRFSDNFDNLNAAQKEAVNAIDGPVMVVAGPGTGKTQLLSMRVANILQQTDTNPGNILCLTFTESGAASMRKRMIDLMGQQAYGVAIHTFHSFGAEVINTHSEYFYHGAHFQAADELSSYEILRGIFDKLPHDSPIRTVMNDEYTYLRDTQGAIGHLKKSGLTPDELLAILDNNLGFIEYAEPLLAGAFAGRISKQTLPILEAVLAQLRDYNATPLKVPAYPTLADLTAAQLEAALQEAGDSGKTTPVTAFKNSWLEKDSSGRFIFRDRRRDAKLRAVASIYYDYLLAMQERTLYDFDDMILRVVHAVEHFSELRYDLQERYQYILVDEFQDTNGAQLRLLFDLANTDSDHGSPNVMVVGDDDQAIYAFQGAEIGNILAFRHAYPEVKIINLVENYRSAKTILESARSVITQGSERLENTLPNLNKQPVAHHEPGAAQVSLSLLPSVTDEYHYVVEQIKAELHLGTKPSEIAVLARNHTQLVQILPYLHAAGIPVAYERRDNILESPPVILLEQLANVAIAISRQLYDVADASMPELLSHPAWGIKPEELWQVGLKAYRDRQFWLEVMLERDDRLKDIAEWLVVVGHEALYEPLEIMLDKLMGSTESQAADFAEAEVMDEPFGDGPREEYVSPLRAYFFEQSGLTNEPARYLTYLGALTTLRRRLSEYRPNKQLYLSDFIQFLQLHRQTGITISNTSQYQEADTAINLMTAHKSKGQEFDTVFVINAVDTIWGHGARSRASLLSFPSNLPITPAGESDDERLRLLFVAMTRARNKLLISAYKSDAKGKDAVIAKYLQTDSITAQETALVQTDRQALVAAQATWHERLVAMPHGEMQKLLAPVLERYALSATHLNNFTDITGGGPQTFLLQNLLRFPQAMSVPATFGSAIHEALKLAHAHLTATGQPKPLEDVLHDYERELGKCRLSQNEHDALVQRGGATLSTYLHDRYDSFSPRQIAEKDFISQGVAIGDAHLSGKIDLIDLNDTTSEAIVTDYKTGKSLTSWNGKTDYDKIKLHKYKQQLMLYKLLIENSRDYRGKYSVTIGALEFVEPDERGQINRLEMFFDPDELERFQKLICVVWDKIHNLDLPDISGYEQNYKGILQFEDDLISGNI